MKKTSAILLLTLAVLVSGSPVRADDKLEKAKNVERNIRQAEPPQESTGTKKADPSGTKTSEYEPPQKSPKTKEPPSPVDKNNPKNDPDVQRGYDEHQKAHGH